MAWPTDDLTNANVNQGTDDPSAARADLDLLITRVKDIIAGRATANGICDLDAGTLVPLSRLPVTSVAKGGTGVTTVSVQSILAGNGTSPLQVITPGTAGQLFTTQGSGSPPNWTNQGFATGVKAWFYQAAAPLGWSLDQTTSDAILGVNIDGGTNGTLGGSWSTDTDGHANSIAEMPIHNHPGSTASSNGGHSHTTPSHTSFSGGGGVISTTVSSNSSITTSFFGNHAHTITVANQGSGSAHVHNMSGWRPKAHSGVICVKD